VLSPFRKADLEVVAEMLDQASEAVTVIFKEGISRAMNRYNRRPPSPQS
jgi:PTH1 family peptidyl-tRNA hydrolase